MTTTTRPTPLKIFLALYRFYGYDSAALTVDGKGPRRVWPARRAAYRLLHDDCGLTWHEVGEVMGRSRAGNLSAQAARVDDAELAEIREALAGAPVRRRQ